jgi:hypothetical protein
MGTLIRVEEYKDGKPIRLGTPFSRRAKLLDFFYAAMFFVGAAGFAALLLTHWRESVGAFLIANEFRYTDKFEQENFRQN